MHWFGATWGRDTRLRYPAFQIGSPQLGCCTLGLVQPALEQRTHLLVLLQGSMFSTALPYSQGRAFTSPHAASLLKYFEVLEPISAIGLSCSFTTHSLYKCSVQSVSYVTDNLEVFVWNYLGLAGCNSVQCRDSATN